MPSGVYERTAEMRRKGIFKHTEETKKKISKNNARYFLGKQFSEEHRRNISKGQIGRIPWNKGLTKETDERVADLAKKISKPKKKRTFETKRKKVSKETRKKLSKAHLGVKFPKERVEKMSVTFSGRNNSNWRGGLSSEVYTIDWTDDLRDAIRKRDDYVCQLCGMHQDELKEFNKKLDVHHIDYQKDNLNPDNLITLCRICHIKTNYNRKYWMKYFKEKKEA